MNVWYPLNVGLCIFLSYQETEDINDYNNNRELSRKNYMVAKTYLLHIVKKSSLYSYEPGLGHLGLTQMYSML